MPKYRKLLVGRPFIRDPPLTQGFEEGVGYIRNIVKHRPVWVVLAAIFGGCTFATAAGSLYDRYYVDEEIRTMYNSRYTVKRLSEVEDPKKECYS